MSKNVDENSTTKASDELLLPLTHSLTSYRDIIRKTLVDRISLNNLYSLRALARDLGIGASRLSEILNGKQGLSLKTAQRMAESLRLSTSVTNFFLDSVESQHSRNPIDRENALLRLRQYTPPIEFTEVSEEYFKAIGDCTHLAFIGLTELADFSSDEEWLADRLKISREKVIEVKMRLCRLGIISLDQNGKIKPVDGYYSVLGGAPSEVIRNFHRSIAGKAIRALEEPLLARRDFTASVMPASSKDIDKIRELSREFRKNVMQVLNSAGEKDSVFCLAVQYFALTE